MKQAKLFAIASLLVGSVVLSGCTSDLEPSGIESGHEVQLFDGSFTYADEIVTDGYGNVILNHPFLTDANVPDYIYQLIPDAGPEPTVGVTSSGRIFVVTLNQVQATDDWGRTWQIVYDYTSFNQPTTQNVYSTFDPLLFVDPDSDFIFVSHLEPDPTGVLGLPWCQYLAYSKDNGKTWSDKSRPGQYGVAPGVQSCLVGVSDHQKLGAAKIGPKTSQADRTIIENWPNKVAGFSKVLYYCHQKYNLVGGPVTFQEYTIDPRNNPLMGTWCETSYDAGGSWNHPVQLSPLRPDCPAGINGMPAAHPDGTVFVPLGAFGARCQLPPTVAVSEDSGVTWTLRVMPNQTIGQVEIDPDITVTADGVAYMAFRGKDQHLWMVRSADKFQTWSEPFRVSPPDQTLNVFTGITSGDNGRIAIHYLGTRDAQEKLAIPSNATGGSFWHSFVSWSFDALSDNPTWHTQQITPVEDPIQIGCVWLSGGAGGPTRCRNLLDFIDFTVDKHGRGIAVSTDGCTPRSGCVGDTSNQNFQSHDREAALLVQDSGYSLFAEKGVLPSLGLQEPRPLPKN